MAVREIIREAVPALKQVAMGAQIESQTAFSFEPGLTPPMIIRGKAFGKIAGQWYRVNFPRPIYEVSVVAGAQYRSGAIPKPTVAVRIAAVTASYATVEVLQDAKITLPSIRAGHVPTALGRFQCGSLIAGVTDGLNNLIVTLENVLLRVNEIVDDLKSAADETKKSIQSLDAKVDDLKNKVNSAFTAFGKDGKSKLDLVLEDLRKNTEGSINLGLQSSLEQLYAAWGVPTNVRVTAAHTRNVTPLGFEFQSFGDTTIYYLAVGSLR